jgi:hypothetical protein
LVNCETTWFFNYQITNLINYQITKELRPGKAAAGSKNRERQNEGSGISKEDL